MRAARRARKRSPKSLDKSFRLCYNDFVNSNALTGSSKLHEPQESRRMVQVCGRRQPKSPASAENELRRDLVFCGIRRYRIKRVRRRTST